MPLITTKLLAQKLTAYVRHDLGLEDLIDWAEAVMMDGEFDDRHLEIIRPIVARLGVADVRAFGLTWDDCEGFLNQLGYKVRIEVEAAPTEEMALSYA